MKYAVYVEGKAEMLFTSDVLMKYSSYDSNKVGLRCINLHKDRFAPVNYPSMGDENSENYYQIVNVNNDSLVISKLKKDIPNLKRKGFEIIIGLRDVYSQSYKETCGEQRIDTDLINRMHQENLKQILIEGVDVRLHFAIMEWETWMMALIDNFLNLKKKNPEEIFASVGVEYESDLEKTVFHPYNKVEKIYRILNLHYSKHENEYNQFLQTLRVEDYEELRNSGKCESFKMYLDSLLSWVPR